MMHLPKMDGYDLSNIIEVRVGGGSDGGIWYLKQKIDEGYEVIFWLPWHSTANRFIGIKYYMAKREVKT